MKEPESMCKPEAQNDKLGRDESFQQSVLRLVHCATSNEALRDDLTQEALVHLWMVKTRRPGQTNSWYLQSCKFRLQHYLNSGRSIDSMKRHGGRVSINPKTPEPDENFDLIDTGASVFSSVSARDLIAQLSRNLLPEEQAVLDCLADGLGSREIGRKLNVSHTIIMKRRQKLAGKLRELETISVPTLQAPRLIGHETTGPLTT
jgi:DNA-directed RNA polymerase specialized sigma24 family protein